MGQRSGRQCYLGPSALLYSHRSHAPPLAGAEIALDRAIGERVVFRRFSIGELVHDERLLSAPMRPDRSRLTLMLEGRLTSFAGERAHELARGDYIACARLGSVRSRSSAGVMLEIDWDPGGVGGELAPELVLGTLPPGALERTEALSEALTRRPLDAAVARAALESLRAQGLPFEPDALEAELAAGSAEDQRVMAALDAVLCRLDQSPDTQDFVTALGCTRRTLTRRLRRLAERHRMYERAEDWRSERDFYRGLVAMMLLSHPDATTQSVARMLGYRSPQALCHAFRRARLPSPGRVRRALRG